MSRLVRPLDGYIFGEFWRIFVATALGLPVLVVIIDLTDQLGKYLERQLPRKDIALSYLFWIPESMFLVLPAAVLFAVADQYVGQFQTFVDALAAGSDPPVTLADAAASLDLVTAWYTSSRTERAVALPLAADHPARSGWAP